MNEALVYLMILLAALILIPVVLVIYRSWDYKRQISGKRKIRTLRDGEHVPDVTRYTKRDEDMDFEYSTTATRLKSWNNHHF